MAITVRQKAMLPIFRYRIMKIFNEKLVVALVGAFVIGLINVPIGAFAATSPGLGSLTDYSVLGASAVTCTGATITDGAVGVSAGTEITGFPTPCSAGGGTHSNDSSAIAAQVDNLKVFGDLDQDCDHTYSSGQDLSELSPLGPGVYCSDGSFLLSGNLNLTGSGVWIFKSASTLVTSAHSSVTGGNSCDIWWRVGSSATIDTDTALKGNIFAHDSVTLNGGAILDGRVMARIGAVTLDGDTISEPTCAVPVSSDVKINGTDESITLTEGVPTDVTVTATITDNNGCGEITGATAKLFRTSMTATCATDPSNCYAPVAMTTSDCSGTVAHYTGTIQVQYYADPTDAGPYAADTWSAHVIPYDGRGAGTAADNTIEMATLTALTVSSSIAYGGLALGGVTPDTTAYDTIVTNTGNQTTIGVQVKSGNETAMVCTTGTIPVGNEKYDAVSTAPYASKTALTVSPVTVAGVSVPKGASGNTATIGWGLQMPAHGVGGSCSGKVVFTAI